MFPSLASLPTPTIWLLRLEKLIDVIQILYIAKLFLHLELFYILPPYSFKLFIRYFMINQHKIAHNCPGRWLIVFLFLKKSQECDLQHEGQITQQTDQGEKAVPFIKQYPKLWASLRVFIHQTGSRATSVLEPDMRPCTFYQITLVLIFHITRPRAWYSFYIKVLQANFII